MFDEELENIPKLNIENEDKVDRSIDEKQSRYKDRELVRKSEYGKKIISLQKKLIFRGVVAFILILLIISLHFYSKNKFKKSETDFLILEKSIEDLKNKSADIEAKLKDARKYNKIWENADNKYKDFTGINTDSLNESFKNLAQEFFLDKPSITISLPQVFEEKIYNLQSLSLNFTNGRINFDALSDEMAIDFIYNFFNILPGYIVIDNLIISNKSKDEYNNQDFQNISTGKINGKISAEVKFRWYFFRNKERQKTQNINLDE